MLHSQRGTQFTGMHTHTSYANEFMSLSELLMVYRLPLLNGGGLLPFGMFLMLSPGRFRITMLRYWTRRIDWLVRHTANLEVIFVVLIKVLPMFNTLCNMLVVGCM